MSTTTKTPTDSAASVTIGGTDYELILTTRATREIAERYGGLENLGDALETSEDIAHTLGEVIWLITLLANQSVAIHNLQHPDDPKGELTVEMVELLVFGRLLDLVDCWLIDTGRVEPVRRWFIDDIIPAGI